jgi:hypothetical protein
LHIGVDQVEDAHQAVAFLNMDLQTSFIGGFRGRVLFVYEQKIEFMDLKTAGFTPRVTNCQIIYNWQLTICD